MKRVTHRFQMIVGMLIFAFALIACADTTVSQPTTAPQVDNAETDAGAETDAEAEVVEPAAEDPALDLARDIDVQTVAAVLDRDDIFLLDVREPSEHETAHIAGNTLIPTGSVADRLAEIPTDKEVIVYCHSGARSARITAYLEQQGFTNVHNMLGGIVAWQGAGFEVE